MNVIDNLGWRLLFPIGVGIAVSYCKGNITALGMATTGVLMVLGNIFIELRGLRNKK